MISSSILALLLFLACFSTQSLSTIADDEFTQLCPVTNETTYHVNVASGCKVYYICNNGKFVDFQRCPDLRSFSHLSKHCELDIPCTSNATLEILEREKSAKSIPLRISFNRITIIKLIDSLLSHINRTNQAQKSSNVVSATPASAVSFISNVDSVTANEMPTSLIDSSRQNSTDEEFAKDSSLLQTMHISQSSHARSVEAESHLLSSREPLPKKEHLQTTEASTPLSFAGETKTGPIGTSKDSTHLERGTNTTSNDQKRYNLLNKLIVPTIREIVNDPSRMSKVALLFRTVFEAVWHLWPMKFFNSPRMCCRDQQ